MQIDDIKKNAPEGATHYGIEHDECGEITIYLCQKPWGYSNLATGFSLDEFEAYLLQIKPL
jgi:hypothetical protein